MGSWLAPTSVFSVVSHLGDLMTDTHAVTVTLLFCALYLAGFAQGFFAGKWFTKDRK